MKNSSAEPTPDTVSPQNINEICQNQIDALFTLHYLMCAHMKQPDLLAGDLEQMEMHLRNLASELCLKHGAIDPDSLRHS
jgi:hypothetical protein